MIDQKVKRKLLALCKDAVEGYCHRPKRALCLDDPDDEDCCAKCYRDEILKLIEGNSEQTNSPKG